MIITLLIMKSYLMIKKSSNWKLFKINVGEKYKIEKIYKLSNKRVSILANEINDNEEEEIIFDIIFIYSIKTGKIITKIHINDTINNVTELKKWI